MVVLGAVRFGFGVSEALRVWDLCASAQGLENGLGRSVWEKP